MLVGEILSEQRSDRACLIGEDRTWTYAELDDLANRFVHQYLRCGLNPGDRVSLIVGNEPMLLAAYFGAWRAGLVANPVNNRLTADEIAYILEHAGSRCVVVSDEFVDVCLKARSGMSSPFEWVLSLGQRRVTDVRAADRASLMAQPASRIRSVAPRAEDGALLLYTSGTTGRPKGVLLTQHNLAAGTELVRSGFEIASSERTLCVMPLFHTNGLMFSNLPFLSAGAAVVLRQRFSASAFWSQCDEHAVTSASVSPTILAMLLEHQARAPASAPRLLQYIKVASAPTPAELADRFERRFGNGLLLETYGLTETTAISTMNPLRGRRKRASIGQALAPQEVRVVDAEGTQVEAGVVGEIEIRGPTLMKSYFRDPDATRAALHDGWLRTGDMARSDADGFFFIVGRKKEMILRGGENISPLEIEQAAAAHPQVREAAAVGLPDRIWGETVALCVVGAPGLTEEALRAHLSAQLSAFKLPSRIAFVEALPRNAMGKLLRGAARELLTQALTPADRQRA